MTSIILVTDYRDNRRHFFSAFFCKFVVAKAEVSLTHAQKASSIFLSPSPVTIAQTPFVVRRGGTIALVGLASQPVVLII